jgi:hypothetical protein
MVPGSNSGDSVIDATTLDQDPAASFSWPHSHVYYSHLRSRSSKASISFSFDPSLSLRFAGEQYQIASLIS